MAFLSSFFLILEKWEERDRAMRVMSDEGDQGDVLQHFEAHES